MPLSLMACSKSEPGSSDGAATDGPVRPTSRVTSKNTEWSVGGLVGGKTETITSEPVPGPPVTVEQPSPPERQPAPQSGLLTAGDTDDLLNPSQYAVYAGRFLQTQGQGLPFIDTRTRVAVRVVDAKCRPVPFARVEVRRTGTPLQLITAADGTASFYPRNDKISVKTTVAATSPAGSASRLVSLAGTRLVTITLPGTGGVPSAMDLALVIDTTGSMGDEMAYLRAELDTIVARLKRNAGNLDLRIGVILYRDEGDDYVVRSVPLTGDITSIRTLLAYQEQMAAGTCPKLWTKRWPQLNA